MEEIFGNKISPPNLQTAYMHGSAAERRSEKKKKDWPSRLKNTSNRCQKNIQLEQCPTSRVTPLMFYWERRFLWLTPGVLTLKLGFLKDYVGWISISIKPSGHGFISSLAGLLLRITGSARLSSISKPGSNKAYISLLTLFVILCCVLFRT